MLSNTTNVLVKNVHTFLGVNSPDVGTKARASGEFLMSYWVNSKVNNQEDQ